MSKRFIIVKYAEDYWPDGVAPECYKVHPHSYSAKECGVTAEFYLSPAAAAPDLERLRHFNPTVHYGIVETSN